MTSFASTWDPISALEAAFAPYERRLHAVRQPPVNLHANEETAIVTAELPGISAGEVQLQVHDGVLTLEARRQPDQATGDPGRHYHRHIALPYAVDAERVEARLRDGVLHVKLTRAAHDRPRVIPVTNN